jgi:hypothetical protein
VTLQADDPRCYVRHVRAAGLCSRGSRAWCAHNGVDWSDFLANGIPASVLEAKRDAIVARVAKLAREEAASGQQGRQ